MRFASLRPFSLKYSAIDKFIGVWQTFLLALSLRPLAGRLQGLVVKEKPQICASKKI